MTVLLNKWDGQKFNDPSCLCDWCGKLGTVKLISVKCISLAISSHLRKICKTCLLAMVAEIDQAVLAATQNDYPRPIARREGN